MDSGRLFFDPSRYGNMLHIGIGDTIFRGPRYFPNMEEPAKRSLFFSSSDEIIDEEYYDEQSPEKKRRLNPEQVHLLEKSFEAENKLEPERKSQLAKKLGLQPRQVAVWFQNRRARWKTKQLERDYDLLKSSYETLASNYDSIAKENEKLKSEVVILREKVQGKEVAGVAVVCKKPDQLVPADEGKVVPVGFSTKAEDRLSSGSGESGVLDEDGPQLLDSGDSYFPDEDYRGCMGAIDGMRPEEDNIIGRSYFSGVFPSVGQQHHEEEGEALGWWVWS